jgi:glutamine amidotransferase
LLLSQLQANPGKTLEQALQVILLKLTDMAQSYQTYVSANVVIGDGDRLIASRFSSTSPAPSLYWTANDPTFPNAVIIASEPLFAGNWTPCPENSIISVGADCEIAIEQI